MTKLVNELLVTALRDTPGWSIAAKQIAPVNQGRK